MSESKGKAVRFQTDVEITAFQTSSLACDVSVDNIGSYKAPQDRAKGASLSSIIAPEGSLAKPNYEDILRRVSVDVHTHISNCEARRKNATAENMETGLFHESMAALFSEDNFLTPNFSYHFVRQPIIRSNSNYNRLYLC